MPRKRNSAPVSLFAFQDIITSVTGIMVLVTLMLALEVIQKKEQAPEAKSREMATDAAAAAAVVDSALAETQTTLAELRRQLEQRQDSELASISLDRSLLERRLNDLREVERMLADDLRKSEAERRQSAERARDAAAEQTAHADTAVSIEQVIAEAREKHEQLQKLRQENRLIFRNSDGNTKTTWILQLDGTTIQAAEIGKTARPTSFPSVANFAQWLQGRSPQQDYFVIMAKPSAVETLDLLRKEITNAAFDLGYDLLPQNQNTVDPEKGAGF